MTNHDEFIQSTSGLFGIILPDVLASLRYKIESEFLAYWSSASMDTCQNVGDIVPPRESAFANVQQWVDDFATFLRCEKYQIAISHMQDLLAVEVPQENEQARMIHQDKVLTASFKFLVHAFVDFQSQQSPEDDIDQCIVEQLFRSMKDEETPNVPNLKQRMFLQWSTQNEAEIMRLCLEQVRDAINEALSRAAGHK